MSFSAKIIADSINEHGNRITSWVLTYPRIIHAEFMTHRSFSRNASSSRAIPFEKMLKSVATNPYIPMKWMKDHKGMQGTEYLDELLEVNRLRSEWLKARDLAMQQAKILNDHGLSKQICNRLLEPFSWYTVIMTATDMENFFALRAHDQAEIHIQKLAYLMLDEYNKNVPVLLKAGEWHIPIGDQINAIELNLAIGNVPHDHITDYEMGVAFNAAKLKVATARCARVSYTVVGDGDKTSNYENDIKLHDRLATSGHFSPFEHCAKAMHGYERKESLYSGNFCGFVQYRKTLKNECLTDDRVNVIVNKNI